MADALSETVAVFLEAQEQSDEATRLVRKRRVEVLNAEEFERSCRQHLETCLEALRAVAGGRNG